MALLLPVFLLLFALLIISSKTALALASLGLTLWFENMVPTLLPFMILSGILTCLKLQEPLCRPLRGLFRRLFHTTQNGAYCIIMGFLCGFPMGAFCVADLYQKGALSKEESTRLIPFCNNIGPVYFYSFAVPMLGLAGPSYHTIPLLTFGMYGIPLLYGIFSSQLHARIHKKNVIRQASAAALPGNETLPSLFLVMDESISHAGKSILRLCGYMILFNVLMLPLYALHADGFTSGILHSVFEISGGIRVLQGYLVLMPEKRIFLQLIMLTALSFGGLCCAGQSDCFMHTVSLSPAVYLARRLLIAAMAGMFYSLCFYCGWLY